MSAAANNGLGVAGVANCMILRINGNGFRERTLQRRLLGREQWVRVVNISWTGADSDALNAAGNYLKVQAHGLLVMAGENGSGQLTYPNQPNIWVISMTDAADNQLSKCGAAIDFAAPGWAVYSTLAGGGYGLGSGTSYAAPIFAGVVARLFTINPVLEPDDVIDMLKATAKDLGNPGWDMWFGWGRINYGAAAAQARARLPQISIVGYPSNQVMIATGLKTRFACQLWRSAVTNGFDWALVANRRVSTNGNQLVLTDPAAPGDGACYRVSVSERKGYREGRHWPLSPNGSRRSASDERTRSADRLTFRFVESTGNRGKYTRGRSMGNSGALLEAHEVLPLCQ